MVRERGLRGLEAIVQSLWGRSGANPEMLCEELSLNDLGLLNWASWTEPRESWAMKEHDGEYLRPNGTAVAMAAQAIVSFSSSAENSLTQNKLWIKFERLIGVLISFCVVYNNYRQRRCVHGGWCEHSTFNCSAQKQLGAQAQFVFLLRYQNSSPVM